MDQPKEESRVKSNEESQPKDAPATEQSGSAPPPEEQKGSILSAPSSYGNAAGSAIESTLGKVGNPMGKGLETVAAPVGGLVEPVVGGLFKSPENFAKATDASNEVEEHNEELERPIGGEEMTAGNPLGLNQGGVKE